MTFHNSNIYESFKKKKLIHSSHLVNNTILMSHETVTSGREYPSPVDQADWDMGNGKPMISLKYSILILLNFVKQS